jgi:predicted nucleotide-binding protein
MATPRRGSSSRNQASAPDEPAVLVVSRSEAEARIQAQIEKGRQIRNSRIDTGEELEAARNQRDRWMAYTSELLRRTFSNESLKAEFSYVGAVFGVLGPRRLDDEVSDFQDGMDTYLTRLEAIHDRLELIPEPPQVALTATQSRPAVAVDNTTVFVVHGHDTGAKEAVAGFLRKLGLTPVILHEQANQGRTIMEKFEKHAQTGFAVVLLTPDDVGAAKFPADTTAAEVVRGLKPRARQNVILELGYFLALLGRGHVCALCSPGVEIPSDFMGVLYVPFDPNGEDWRYKLAREMKAAGLPVDMNDV